MIHHSSLSSTLTVICGLLLFGVHCGDGGGFGQDPLECQVALARLQSCCSGFDPSAWACNENVFRDTQSSAGCNGGSVTTITTTTYATLDPVESACVTSEDCGTMLATGVCTRVNEVHGPRTRVVTHNQGLGSDGCGGGGTFYFGDAAGIYGEAGFSSSSSSGGSSSGGSSGGGSSSSGYSDAAGPAFEGGGEAGATDAMVEAAASPDAAGDATSGLVDGALPFNHPHAPGSSGGGSSSSSSGSWSSTSSSSSGNGASFKGSVCP